jgi:hypothetical protein
MSKDYGHILIDLCRCTANSPCAEILLGRDELKSFSVTFETGCTDGHVRREVIATSEKDAREFVEREIEGEGGVVLDVEETYQEEDDGQR